MAADDDFFDKALEGFAMFALNQGEVCTCPSRALIQESIYDQFMERALQRVEGHQAGQPARSDTMIGAQASKRAAREDPQLHRHRQAGRRRSAHRRRSARMLDGDLADGYYVEPTIFKGHNKMRIFQEEIFGPVVSVTTFKDDDDALAIANDTLYGLGAGVWTPRHQHAPTAWAAPSRPAACGPTATTPTRRTRRSAATSSRASAARITR